MKLIAHRGLTHGPDLDLENHPDQIIKSLAHGFDCEVDVWYVSEQWYLGHDYPKYQILDNFLNRPGLWIHAKNLDALLKLQEYNNLHYFWHQTDHYTLTSQGIIWTYPGYLLTKNSIMVMPEWHDSSFASLKNANCLGICSDFVSDIRQLIFPNR